MADREQSIEVRGELLQLLPEKAAYWHARKSLMVADTHFGKAATFRRFGLPVPEMTTQETINRLASTLDRTQAARLIVLGDFIHSNVTDAAHFEASLVDWRRKYSRVQITLVFGNHDRGREDLFERLDIRVVPKFLDDPPFAFSHEAMEASDQTLFNLCGHVHPQVELREGRKKLKLPSFWFAENVGLLPAFGSFTGCSTISPGSADKVFVVADDKVVKIDQNVFVRRA